ncbi:hypothetical protein [Actinomadura sp. 6N118]|uniref:hypothetical protein n=1 Tax=Actinomadura sp. 6N118 TaxID=3375151 RepID=UPI00378DC97B
MADEVTGASNGDHRADDAVMVAMQLPSGVLRELEDEAARWAVSTNDMLVITFRAWMNFQILQAQGVRTLLLRPDGSLDQSVLVAGSKAPLGGLWLPGKRPKDR